MYTDGVDDACETARSAIATGVPRGTLRASFLITWFVTRTQPWLTSRPTGLVRAVHAELAGSAEVLLEHGGVRGAPEDEEPDAYQHVDDRDVGWTKVVLHPHGALSDAPAHLRTADARTGGPPG